MRHKVITPQRRPLFKLHIVVSIIVLLSMTTYGKEHREVWDYDNWVTTFMPHTPFITPYDSILHIQIQQTTRANPWNRSLVRVLDGYRHRLHHNTDSIHILSKGVLQYAFTYDAGKPTSFRKEYGQECIFWSYDSLGRLESLQSDWRSGKQGIVRNSNVTTLTYDQRGNISTSTTGGAPESYGLKRVDRRYDQKNRLIQATSILETGHDSDLVKQRESWKYRYSRDTIEAVVTSQSNKMPVILRYLKEYSVIPNGRLQSKVSALYMGHIRKYADSTVYSYEGDSVTVRDDFQVRSSSAPRHDITEKTSFNAQGQPTKCETLLHKKGLTKVRIFEYAQSGELVRSVLSECKKSGDAITRDSTHYVYDKKGNPEKVSYFKRELGGELRLLQEFTFTLFPLR